MRLRVPGNSRRRHSRQRGRPTVGCGGPPRRIQRPRSLCQPHRAGQARCDGAHRGPTERRLDGAGARHFRVQDERSWRSPDIDSLP